MKISVRKKSKIPQAKNLAKQLEKKIQERKESKTQIYYQRSIINSPRLLARIKLGPKETSSKMKKTEVQGLGRGEKPERSKGMLCPLKMRITRMSHIRPQHSCNGSIYQEKTEELKGLRERKDKKPKIKTTPQTKAKQNKEHLHWA